jgi:hypothetical protein
MRKVYVRSALERVARTSRFLENRSIARLAGDTKSRSEQTTPRNLKRGMHTETLDSNGG